MITQKSKKVLLFAILIVSLFALTTNKSEAQCPAGWSFQNFTININGCMYSVNICYRCSPTALDATEFNIVSTLTPLDPNCSQSWTRSQMIAEAYTIIGNRIYLTQLCEARPCDEPPKSRMKFIYYSCWENYRDNNGNVHIQACTSNAQCEVEYEVCRNGSSLVWTFKSATYVGSTPTCNFPPPGRDIPIPENNNESSGCYRVDTPCDIEV